MPFNRARIWQNGVISSHSAPYTRKVAVYVPKQYVAGTTAPFIVGADGPDLGLFTALDNLIAAHKVPVMVAISIGNGGSDAQGSERGLEYDTMSGLYAEFVEKEVLPLVEKQYNVKLTKDPNGPRHHGRQFRRIGRARDGMVSPRVVSSRPHLLRNVRQSAVAVESGNPARRLGDPRTLDSKQPPKADPHLDGGRRPG